MASLTGDASSSYEDGAVGAKAVFDQVNAAGGVNGHPIKLMIKDDTSSPGGNLTAAEQLVQTDHAMVIMDDSSFTFGASQFLQKAGIPVTGGAFDGPEWATAPNSNMFSYTPPDSSPVNGIFYTYTGLGKFLHELGVTSYGGLGYAISPSSSDAIVAGDKSAAAYGIKTCYTNRSVQFGAVDFTSDVLQIKQAGCNGVTGAFVESSNLALSTAITQAGLAKKVRQVYYTGYDSSTTATPADASAFNGDFAAATISFSPPDAAAAKMLEQLEKYDPSFKAGDLPDYGLEISYLTAQLTAYGLSVAGPNPTAATFISSLRKVSSWNDGGLLSSPTSFTNFGTPAMFPKTACGDYMHLVNGKWSLYGGAPVCGTRISLKISS